MYVTVSGIVTVNTHDLSLPSKSAIYSLNKITLKYMDETRGNWSSATKEGKTSGKGWNCWGPLLFCSPCPPWVLRVQEKAWSQDTWVECVAVPTLWTLEAEAPPVWPTCALQPSPHYCWSYCSPAWPNLSLRQAYVMHAFIPAHPSPSPSHRAQQMGISRALDHIWSSGPDHHNRVFTMTKTEKQ